MDNPQSPIGGSRTSWSRWAGIAVTLILVLVAFAVQWGVVMTKLGHVEKRLDEMIMEARAVRVEYQSIERRMAFIEGQIREQEHQSP